MYTDLTKLRKTQIIDSSKQYRNPFSCAKKKTEDQINLPKFYRSRPILFRKVQAKERKWERMKFSNKQELKYIAHRDLEERGKVKER